MAHIKKMVMHGFKSFARRTEIPFDQGINVIVGPNGSGKSNVSDALCFVLGRLSVKSMRAAKAKNLIFMGSKYVKPAREASVELVFDNSDRAFGMDSDEITIKRAVRANGQGIYKINNETKTRAEIIEMLAHAGVDPYGFNIILQGEIQSIVRMHGEERRKIIEEVAGISIYESRKEKSIKELEKTDEKLKEIGTVLRERTAYLNNLEKEKTQAEKYQELKVMAKRLKGSLLKKKHDDKLKEVGGIEKAIEEKRLMIEKKRERTLQVQNELGTFTESITSINKHIQQATGLEQGKLREEITNVRAELEGLKVRKESYENRRAEVQKRIEEMKKSIPDIEKEIGSLREQSPHVAKKSADLKKKKETLAGLEQERKRLLTFKTELQGLRDRIQDKQRQRTRASAEASSMVTQLEELGRTLKYDNEKSTKAALENLKQSFEAAKQELDAMHTLELEHQRAMSVAEATIANAEEIKKKVQQIDVCPLCQSTMTQEHVSHVFNDSDSKIELARKTHSHATETVSTAVKKKKTLKEQIADNERVMYALERELSTHVHMAEKQSLLKQSVNYEQTLAKEVAELEARRESLEQKTTSLSDLESQYESALLDIEEVSSRTVEDLDTTLLYKEREIEKIRGIVDRSITDLKEIEERVQDLTASIEQRDSILSERVVQEEELNARFNRMFAERDATQKKVQEWNLKLSDMQNEVRQVEDQVNYLKIGKAKLDGERESLDVDMGDFADIEVIQGSINYLDERLKKTQETLETIGSINMRALEVYEEVKNQYDVVKEKVDTLEKEKIEIAKIIEEIDKKKYRTFTRTYNAINELFTANFSRLTTKVAAAGLEIENKENVFEGGVNITVKMGKGKYFDVTSLSGGEQTMVALSLLFAIQEYRPYQFYILDEIDAALDKRNSERLAALLTQYMKAGQYIVITHNDAIIMNSQALYGVSMHDGESKVLSLHVDEPIPPELTATQVPQVQTGAPITLTRPEDTLTEESDDDEGVSSMPTILDPFNPDQ